MCKSSKSKLSKEIIPSFLQKSKQINRLNLQKSKQINCKDMIGVVFFRRKFYDVIVMICSTLLESYAPLRIAILRTDDAT